MLTVIGPVRDLGVPCVLSHLGDAIAKKPSVSQLERDDLVEQPLAIGRRGDRDEWQAHGGVGLSIDPGRARGAWLVVPRPVLSDIAKGIALWVATDVAVA